MKILFSLKLIFSFIAQLNKFEFSNHIFENFVYNKFFLLKIKNGFSNLVKYCKHFISKI